MASNNQVYRILPAQLNNLQKLRQVKMASNALSGELPGFTESFAALEELDVSKQTIGFTGSIPEDIQSIYLCGWNQLTGSIPPLMGTMTVLEVFNLSNNLLDSLIPSKLGMLDGE